MAKKKQPAGAALAASEAYEKRKSAARQRNAEIALAGRDIGAIPDVADLGRRARSARDFRFFCETYFPRTFSMAWSDDHLKVIGYIEQAVMHGGQLAVAMPRGSGKALALDTPLPTPRGWTTMKDVRVGDSLYDERGAVCRVTGATEVMKGRSCYRVIFDDGESVVCCEDHQWTVNVRHCRRGSQTLTTKEMAGRVACNQKRGWLEVRYSIPVAGPVEGKTSGAWLVAPYMLGVWLGDGNTSSNRVTVGDADLDATRSLIERHEPFDINGNRKKTGAAATYTVGKGIGVGHCGMLTPTSLAARRDAYDFLAIGVSVREAAGLTGLKLGDVSNIKQRPHQTYSGRVSLKVRLGWLGVLGNKHIPAEYQRASVADRMELLRGLMDTDGSISKNGSTAEYVTKLPALRDDVMELLAGLGFKRRCRTKIVMGRPYYRITFTPTDGRIVFGLPRKAARQQTRKMRISATRRIVDIQPVPSVPVRCVQVDSPSHLYLCGRGMVPTHNSAMSEAAVVWAMLNGHHEFVCLIGASKPHAEEMLDSIKMEFETNELLCDDYPEAVVPIRRLEGIANRCKGQLYGGMRTYISWTADEIILPTVRPAGWDERLEYEQFLRGDGSSLASGAIIRVTGLEGRIRGMKHKLEDGRTVRPSLVIPDDPQSEESARSPSQNVTRERLLAGAVLGLAGPGVKISALMPCTVIEPDDCIDTILDRQKHPEWNGVRMSMLYSFPENMALWERYREMWADGLRAGDGGKAATQFYVENRAAMDRGARVAWPVRYNPDEASAIQNAMNLWLRDEESFWREYQNKPLRKKSDEADLTADLITAKVNRIRRGVAPSGSSRLTGMIDVQGSLLYWLVCAWGDDFGGSVIDYGTFPDQGRPYFTLRDAQKTLAGAFPGHGLEASIFAGLGALAKRLCGEAWPVDGGGELRLGRLLVDANWGTSTDTVYQFARQSQHAAVITPSHGKFVGAGTNPLNAVAKKPGDRMGLHWRIPASGGKRPVLHVVYDTNYWKSFVAARLLTPMGDRGCLALFGDKPGDHRLLADHLLAETRVKTEGRGRTVDEWKQRPEKPDNHWLDTLCGCAVAASIEGCALLGAPVGQPKEKKARVSFAELQRQKRGRG